MLVNIHFQKYNRFFKAICTLTMGVLEPRQKTSAIEI